MSALEAVLAAWLPEQRWFGGKGRGVQAVRVEHEERLPGTGDVRHTIVQVTDDSGQVERYQLLLGRSDAPLAERLEPALVGEVDRAQVYDALQDPQASSELLGLLAEGRDLSRLSFRSTAELDVTLAPRLMGAEQSNSSVVYDDAYVLKLFRRLQPGLNPDLELTRALAEAGSAHVAPILGWIEGDLEDAPEGERTTLAMLQVFLRGGTEGWASATASVRDLFAEADLHPDEVGGDFASESERLGAATAEVHALLAQALPSAVVGTQEAQETARTLHARLDAAVEAVPELAPYADRLRSAYDAVAEHPDPVPVQRIHGDFHLGQVLRTLEGWVLLDFEGEPARSLAERRELMSPLRDVAGMLRSFDYAARHLLADRASAGAGHEHQLAYRAAEWAERNRSAFCDGYARASGTDPRDCSVLLRAFELDKAVYEVVYEAQNRPTWLPIPMGSIERLAAHESPVPSPAQEGGA